MTIRFLAINSATAWALRTGLDANGMAAEHAGPSTGTGTPCRHCLRQVPPGRPYLIAAHRPFSGLNPYTETGPIFLCEDGCPMAGTGFPNDILTAQAHIVRAYCSRERILYGTGGVIATEHISARCTELLARPEVAFVHVRSASNNCFLCRVERA